MNKNDVKALLRKSNQPLLRKSNQLFFSKRGLRGGSIGPMTCTNAHLERNKEVEQEVLNILSREGFYQTADVITNGTLSFKLIWDLRPTHKMSEGYDPMYQTYWATILWK